MQRMNYEPNPGRSGNAGCRIPGLLLSYGRLVLQPLVRNERAGETQLRLSQGAVSRSRA
jgi:hypothetical protein